MKQLFIFSKHKQASQWHLYVDGASRNNPGPAGIGIYVLKNDEIFLKKAFYLGQKTNNQAEYLALLFGLLLIQEYFGSHDKLEIRSDSELLVKQIIGYYSVKNPNLLKIFKDVKKILSNLDYQIFHITRNKNKEADKLANEAIDRKILLPEEFREQLRKYE